MSSAAAFKLWDYDTYATLPADRNRYEVIEGELYVSPAPSSWHQTLSRRIQFELYNHYERTRLGQVFDAPIDVIFSPKNVTQPDLAVVLTGGQARVVERGIEGPPDVIVEVLSKSTRHVDLDAKRVLYAQYGVREYWLADPNAKTITVCTQPQLGFTQQTVYTEQDTLQSEVLVDFKLVLAPLFEGL